MNYSLILHLLPWEVARGFVEDGWMRCEYSTVYRWVFCKVEMFLLVRLNVTSKKLTSKTLTAIISILNRMSLKISIIFFLVLSFFWPLHLVKQVIHHRDRVRFRSCLLLFEGAVEYRHRQVRIFRCRHSFPW